MESNVAENIVDLVKTHNGGETSLFLHGVVALFKDTITGKSYNYIGLFKYIRTQLSCDEI